MIVRAPRPEGNFYILDKRISEDRHLSWAARGLLVYLLGKPDYWQVSPAALVAETAGSAKATGRDGIYSLLNELIEAGYMTRQQARSADGSMGPIRYTVSEQPQEESPGPGEPHPAEPYPVEPTQVSTDMKQGLTKKQGLNSGAAQQVAFDGQRMTVSDDAMAGFLRAYPSIDVRAEGALDQASADEASVLRLSAVCMRGGMASNTGVAAASPCTAAAAARLERSRLLPAERMAEALA